MRRAFCLAVVMVALHGAAGRASSEFYVSPDGSPKARGTMESPWDLRTALAGADGKIHPDDTVYLLDGRYTGHFTAAIAGAPGHPITFRAAPGAHPILDGNWTTVTTDRIPAGAQGASVTVKLASTADIHVNDDLRVGDELFRVLRVDRREVTATRGRGGFNCVDRTCAAHTVGEPAFVLIPILFLPKESPYLTFRDLEVTDSGTDSRGMFDVKSLANLQPRRRDGVSVRAAGTKIIDCVIHDTLQGLAAWIDAPNSEYSGNIIYNNGILASDRGHGHGIYTQNETGTKLFFGDISFNNFGFAWQQYGSPRAFLDNFTWDHVVAFNTRSSVTTPPYNFGALWGGNVAMHNLRIQNSAFYHAFPTIGYDAPGNTGIVVRNNVFRTPFRIVLSKDVSVVGNLFAAPPAMDTTLVSLAFDRGGSASDLTFAGNTYHHANTNFPYHDFYFGTAPTGAPDCKYYWFNATVQGFGYCDKQSWQDVGYDRDGVFVATQPTGARVDVFPSPYNPARVYVVIFNWDHAPTMSIDVSRLGIASGTSYRVRNVADYFKDVKNGVYDGSGSITLAMTGHTVAVPNGWDRPLGDDTFPEFGCFVLEF